MKNNIKKYLFLVLRIFIAVALLFYLFKNVDFKELISQIKTANLLYVFLGLLLYGIIAALAIYRWKLLLLVHNIIVSNAKLTKLFFIGLFFNNAMPGLTGGDIIKGYYTAKETQHHKPEAVTTVFLDRIVGVIGLLMLGLIALLFNLHNPQFKKLALFLFVIFIGLIIFVPFFMSKTIIKKIPFIHSIMDILPFKHTLIRIYHTFYKYKSHKKVVFSTILLSMILQSIYIVMVYFMGKAIGMNVYLYHYFLFIPIISTVAAIPISISGLGVNENLFVYCFGLVGAQEESALVIAFMARIVLLIWSLPGWYYYMTVGDSKITEETMKEEMKKLEDQI